MTPTRESKFLGAVPSRAASVEPDLATGNHEELGASVILLCTMYGAFLVSIILMNLGWL